MKYSDPNGVLLHSLLKRAHTRFYCGLVHWYDLPLSHASLFALPTECLKNKKLCSQCNYHVIKGSSICLRWCMNCDMLWSLCNEVWTCSSKDLLLLYFNTWCNLWLYFRNSLFQNCTNVGRVCMDPHRTPDVLYLWMILTCQWRRYMELSHQLNCSDSTWIMASGQYVWCCDNVKYSFVELFENTLYSSAYVVWLLHLAHTELGVG